MWLTSNQRRLVEVLARHDDKWLTGATLCAEAKVPESSIRGLAVLTVMFRAYGFTVELSDSDDPTQFRLFWNKPKPVVAGS